MAEPILKWAGGKRTLLPQLERIITRERLIGHRYYEPFIGSGALAFDLEYPATVINDLNSELINVYNVVKSNVEPLLDSLSYFQSNHSQNLFYELRELDRNPEFTQIHSDVFRAARTIYLNKTCFNGLYRVNSKGYFNTPIGRTTNGTTPDIIQRDKLLELHRVLQTFEIRNVSYREACQDAREGDILYFDPPYAAFPDSASFTAYSAEGWTDKDLQDLKNLCDELVDRGCHIVLSNNGTPFVRELFNDEKYIIENISVRRSISCNSESRKKVEEVIIYDRRIKV